MKLFNLDSPLMVFLGRVADLLWLNLLTIICCIPIITAGASITAMHYVVLKMARDEDGYITKSFFKSFKQNFKQATVIWLLVIVVVALLAFDYWYVLFSGYMKNPRYLFMGITAAAIFVVCTLVYLFPILSHFKNTIKGTLRNAFFMSVLELPKTVLQIILIASPVGLILLGEYFRQVSFVIPLAYMFFLSAPAFFCAKLYSKSFKKFEPEEKDLNDDFTWSVNSDVEAGEEVAENSSKELPTAENVVGEDGESKEEN